ncbi:hypothetical protein F5876DRAFT_51946, partial [Lentinula aff. lateritia]
TINAAFWTKILEFFKRNPRIKKPDFVLGDTNFVEEPLDRLPARNDPTSTTEAFDELKCLLQLEDGWRSTYPSTLKYTYRQKHNNQITRHSRLDRIYTTPENMTQTFEWKIEHTGINTDHDMISVRFTCEAAPITGKGRWTFPVHLIYDKVMKEFIKTEGKGLEDHMNQIDEEDYNPNHNHQTLWADFKRNFIHLGRERAKIVVPRMTKEIACMEARIDSVSNDPLLSEEERSLSTAALKEALESLEKRKLKSVREQARANYTVHGETISRYWSNLNRDRRKRDLILRLQIPNNELARDQQIPEDGNITESEITQETQYELNSQRMANMMRDYHENLQSDNHTVDTALWEQTTMGVLNQVSARLPEQHTENLRTRLSTADIEESLKLSANQKAPGLDGISYEIWKIMNA